MMNAPVFKSSLVLMGVSGIVAQIILLRELLVSFYGNELTLGIILANWLLLEAIGSFLIGKSVEKTEKKMEVFALLQVIFSVALPLVVYFSRIFKTILLATPGEGLGFGLIFCSSFLILLPVAIPHGALFTYGCKLYSECLREDASSIGKVYVLETVGTIIGGLLITFLLIQYSNSFQVSFAVSLANAFFSVLLLWPKIKIQIPPVPPLLKGGKSGASLRVGKEEVLPKGDEEEVPLRNEGEKEFQPLRGGTSIRRNYFRKSVWGLSALFVPVFASLLLTSASTKINLSSIRSQWKGLNVIHHENSVYGNITVTKRGEQYTFFTDGTPSMTVPVPDVGSIEDFVHFPLLFHEKPETVLILSGGAGGMIHEVLKYPVMRIDYVELDPLLLRLIRRFRTPITDSEFSDRRVRIHDKDGRFFVNGTKDRYDIVLIGLPAPLDLQSNRLFTAEFFSIAKQKMNPAGVLALSLPGSLTYISPGLRDLNGCILDALKSVYRHVRIIPGDGSNLYLASDSEKLENTPGSEIARRLEGRNVQASLLTRSYIDYRLQERWSQWFLESMEGRKTRINSDFRPLGVFFNLSYWNALFSPYLTSLFKWFEGFNLECTAGVTALLTLLAGAIFVVKPRAGMQSVPYALFITGFSGMIFNLAILFAFQTLFGYLYQQIGLLVTIFMAGVALGSLYMTRRMNWMTKDLSLFLALELSILLFSLLLPAVFFLSTHFLQDASVHAFLYAVLLTLSFLSGALIGLQFPLASKIYMGSSPGKGGLGRAAGWLYGVDLLGGFCGGLLGGVILLPILGLNHSCFMVAITKASSLFLFLLFTKRQR
jgi:spermidine synthase